MADNQRIALIGGGRMGRALVQGMVRSQVVAAGDVVVSEPDPANQAWWRKELPEVRLVTDNTAAVADVKVVLIAVKPDVVAAVAREIAAKISSQIIVSVAAGLRLSKLQDLFMTERVVRVMPNTPALVQAGASAYCLGKGVKADEGQWIAKLLESVGVAVAVPDKWMDAVTGLSGSGPAMVCLMIEALSDGGVLAGLPRPLATKLAAQTVLGTAKMVLEEGQHPGELKDQVASPGGTTIAALQVLEQNAVRGALMTAVKRAADRSTELG